MALWYCFVFVHRCLHRLLTRHRFSIQRIALKLTRRDRNEITLSSECFRSLALGTSRSTDPTFSFRCGDKSMVVRGVKSRGYIGNTKPKLGFSALVPKFDISCSDDALFGRRLAAVVDEGNRKRDNYFFRRQLLLRRHAIDTLKVAVDALDTLDKEAKRSLLVVDNPGTGGKLKVFSALLSLLSFLSLFSLRMRLV